MQTYSLVCAVAEMEMITRQKTKNDFINRIKYFKSKEYLNSRFQG
jgi:hypothetical protein